jgi:hypothetical protein
MHITINILINSTNCFKLLQLYTKILISHKYIGAKWAQYNKAIGFILFPVSGITKEYKKMMRQEKSSGDGFFTSL